MTAECNNYLYVTYSALFEVSDNIMKIMSLHKTVNFWQYECVNSGYACTDILFIGAFKSPHWRLYYLGPTHVTIFHLSVDDKH